MADVKWSEFSSGSAITGADLMVGLQAGANAKWTWNQAATFAWATPTFTGTVTSAGSVVFSAAASGPTLKRGANGRVGTFVADGTNAVTVSNSSIAITDAIIISLNTVGGTIVTQPVVKTITAGVGFTVTAGVTDTSTYNYAIIKNAA